MISVIGQISLCAAVLVAAGAVLASAAGARRAAGAAIGAIALLFTITSAALLTALLKSDFRFEYVHGYTERALPWGYKLAAFWAGQEGSLLLWGWMLAVLSWFAVLGWRTWKGTDHATAVAVLALANGFFAALLLFAANPFTMVAGIGPPDGRGLNPMLQDPGMIAHPPLLFLGYAGFTIPFAVLVGVLVADRRDNHWIALIRRWLLVAWLFLTAGIVLGAWWAYIELGWGGYWAWDPVENASLLPWLTATALLHSIMVQQHRGMFKVWNAALIALSFILCIFGTYLTRSGVIESVHAFAPSLIATFFLVFLGLCTAGTAGLMLWRHRALRPDHQLEGLVSREGAFLLGNVLLVIMMLTTLVGTVFPLLSGLVMDDPVTVKQPFYNTLVAPMGIVLAGVMALGPVLAFGKSAAGKIARSLVVPGAIAVVVTAAVAVVGTRNPWALVCAAIVTLGTGTVVVGFIRSTGARRRSTGESWPTAALRLVDRDHRRYGGQLAHLGLMLTVVGVAASSLFPAAETYQLRAGESARIGRYALTFVSLDEVREVNFTAVQATVTLRDADGAVTTLRPQRRFYDTWRDQPNSEVAIRSSWREDLYVVLAGWEEGGEITAIQAFVNPLVLWIWIGGIVMTVGGLFCVLPRLLPQPQRVPAVEPAVEPVTTRPAEGEPSAQPALQAVPLETETPA